MLSHYFLALNYRYSISCTMIEISYLGKPANFKGVDGLISLMHSDVRHRCFIVFWRHICITRCNTQLVGANSVLRKASLITCLEAHNFYFCRLHQYSIRNKLYSLKKFSVLFNNSRCKV